MDINGLFKGKLYFLRSQRGSNILQGRGSKFFQVGGGGGGGGANVNIEFQVRGGGVPNLWIRACV